MLYRRIAILVFSTAILIPGMFSELSAQKKMPENLPKYDYAPYHFGFIIGLNSMNFVVKPIKEFNQQDTIKAVSSQAEMGFDIGIVTNLRIGEHFDLRFIPTLAFGERTMLFTRTLHDTIYFDTKKKVESTYLDFPLELKFKSRRLYNSRAYVLVGVKYSIDMASQANKKAADDEIRIKLKKNDYSFEAGVGFDFYTTHFKFGTELKMAYGIRDLLVHESNIYAQSMDRLNSKIFQFTFTFE